MTTIKLRHEVRSQVLGVLFCFGLLFLVGCASTQNTNLQTAAEMTTDSDEDPARARARTRLELAVNYFEQGQTRVALDEVKQSLAQDPKYAEALSLRGLIYMRLNELRLAEDSFKQALNVSPGDGNAQHNLAWLMCQQGRYVEAEAVFAKVVALPYYRDKAKSYMAQGLCALRAGRVEDAEKGLAKSYELDPSNPVTGYNLSSLLYKRGEFTRAQFYSRRLNNSEYANAESLWLGIKVERKLDDKSAIKQLADQLVKRFYQSKEMQLYEKGSFDD